MMTAAEAAEIRDSLMRTSQHLHDDVSNPNGITHSPTCDCQFLRALDAVIAGEARTERVFATAVKAILSMEAD